MNELTENQNNKISYFIEYWQEFTKYINDGISKLSYFSGLEQDFINPILYNPKELFNEFIDEIERKNLSNADNKKFFIDNINELVKLKLKALEFLEPTLKIIQQQFNQKNDFSCLLHLLKFALEEIKNYRLGRESVKELEKIIFNENSLEYSK